MTENEVNITLNRRLRITVVVLCALLAFTSAFAVNEYCGNQTC